jgi:hypothetical protein
MRKAVDYILKSKETEKALFAGVVKERALLVAK